MIKKAVVPVAGKGTRLMPITSVVPKALLPLVVGDNIIQCILHLIIEQVVLGGIEEVGIVVSEGQVDLIRQYFKSVISSGFSKLPSNIEYIIQKTPAGFGDAVLQAADFIGDDSFVLLLGDHIHVADNNRSLYVHKIVKAFQNSDGVAMIGVQQVPASELSKVGVVGGERIKDNIYRCIDFIEKPDVQTARQQLKTDNLPEGKFLAHCGIYAFTAEIFDCLLHVSKIIEGTGGEIELSDAQSLLLERYPDRYLLFEIAGRAYDIGTPAGYFDAQMAYRNLGYISSTKVRNV